MSILWGSFWGCSFSFLLACIHYSPKERIGTNLGIRLPNRLSVGIKPVQRFKYPVQIWFLSNICVLLLEWKEPALITLCNGLQDSVNVVESCRANDLIKFPIFLLCSMSKELKHTEWNSGLNIQQGSRKEFCSPNLGTKTFLDEQILSVIFPKKSKKPTLFEILYQRSLLAVIGWDFLNKFFK